jgi:uncharacterized protein (DUF427 family)
MAFLKRPKPERPGKGQRSVWDFPRPPAIEREPREIVIEFGGRVIVRTTGAFRVLETSHPPVFFVPPSDIEAGALVPSSKASTSCEWKGRARYFDVVSSGARAEEAAFAYDRPVARFAELAGHVSFYAGPMDACLVGGVRARPQPGGFYSGWITPDVCGPFKGIPGSWGW